MSLRTFQLIVLTCVLFIFNSCETIKQYSEKALSTVGFSALPDKASQKANKRPSHTKKTPEPDAKPHDLQQSNTNTEIMPVDVVLTKINASSKPQPTPKTVLQNPTHVDWTTEAPITIKKRMGGSAQWIQADNEFVYVGFPQGLTVFDKTLTPLTQLSLSRPLLSVQKLTVGSKIYLALTEENHTLEIAELNQDQTTTPVSLALKVVMNSNELGGDFLWINPTTLIVSLPEKLQIWDFTNLDKVSVLTELPITGVTEILPVDSTLYLARHGQLDILETATWQIISSLRIGKNFGFFGMRDTRNSKTLWLTLANGQAELHGLQALTLSNDGTQITNFGATLSFEKSLVNAKVNLKQGWLLGREAGMESQPLQLYSLDHKRFLRGELSTKTDTSSWQFTMDTLYLITSDGISSHTITLDPDSIRLPPTASSTDTVKPLATPLAQIGSIKTTRDDYTLHVNAKAQPSSHHHKVVLLDPDHIVLFAKNSSDSNEHLSTSVNFSEDKIIWQDMVTPPLSHFDKILTTDFGLLAYAEETHQIFFSDITLKKLQLLPIAVGRLLSWYHLSAPEGELLIITQETLGKNKSGKYLTQIFLLKSAQEATLLSQITTSETPFAFHSATNELVILTNSGMSFYNITDLKKPVLNETDSMQFEEKLDLRAIKPFLVNNRVYALAQINSKMAILAFSVVHPITQRVILADVDITPENFEGSSFSRGGQLFILPSASGTYFYNMADLDLKTSTQRQLKQWMLPASYVDVTNKGNFICVALGSEGVACGDLLF